MKAFIPLILMKITVMQECYVRTLHTKVNQNWEGYTKNMNLFLFKPSVKYRVRSAEFDETDSY
jgi:hypothetical protein